MHSSLRAAKPVDLPHLAELLGVSRLVGLDPFSARLGVFSQGKLRWIEV